jgi:hypothetical protein
MLSNRLRPCLLLFTLAALLSACCGSACINTCCPRPCCPPPIAGEAGPQKSLKPVERPETPMPPAPFKRIDLQHKNNAPGHKKITSATVTGKAASDCSGSARFPPPPGVNGPPHVLVMSSAPLDFQPSPITNPVWWPGLTIPTNPQDVKGVTFEIQFEGSPQMHPICFSAPGGKQLDSLLIKYDSMQGNQHHLGGTIRYIDSYDPVTGAPVFKTEPIDKLVP